MDMRIRETNFGMISVHALNAKFAWDLSRSNFQVILNENRIIGDPGLLFYAKHVFQSLKLFFTK